MSVTSAVSRIENALSEGISDWGVSKQDLMDARGALNGLSLAKINEVISKLDDDTLRGWNLEMNGLAGGLERRREGRPTELFGAEPVTRSIGARFVDVSLR